MRKYDLKGFAVKNVKNSRGHEGEPCPYGSIYYNNKKVGDFATDTWGGPMNINFTNDIAKKAFYEAVEAMPPCEFHGTMLDFNDEMFIDELCTEFDLKKECKKKTLFVLSDTDEDSVMEIKHPYGPDIKAYLEKKYSKALVEIINERFVDEVAKPITQKMIDKASKGTKPLTPAHVCVANVDASWNALRAAVTVQLVSDGFKEVSAEYINTAPEKGVSFDDELKHALKYVSVGLERKVA